jgi:ribosomal protein L32E
VGSTVPENLSYENKLLEKELKQKNFAEELKRQIEERDYLRKKEEWRKTKATHFGNP